MKLGILTVVIIVILVVIIFLLLNAGRSAKVKKEQSVIRSAAPAAKIAESTAENEDNSSSITVVLKNAGDNKIAVLKEVREITGLGLNEAKGLVDNVPSVIKKCMDTEEAEKIKQKLEQAGATVELK